MHSNPITIYGIPNCSSVKKAREWMTTHDVAHEFHDFKKQGLSAEHLSQALVKDAASAQQLMLEWPSLVKRPVVVKGHQVVIGVNPQAWQSVVDR